jgi:mRNA interferase RelE/StbE
MAQRPYKVRSPDALARLIRHLHPQIKRKLRAAVEQIAADPHSGKALKDELTGLWSFRVGRFRLVYRVTGARALELVAFGGRKTIYEETYRLIARQTRRDAP